MHLILNFSQHRSTQPVSSTSLRPFQSKPKTPGQSFNKTTPQSLWSFDKKYKKQTTDIRAFREKQHIEQGEYPLSCFKLIHIPQPKLFISIDDLNKIDFPVLSYTTSELIGFSRMIVENSAERKRIAKSFNLLRLIELVAENYNVSAYHNFSHAFSVLLLLFQSYTRSEQVRKMVTERQWFFVMLAALAHDLNHPGTTNAFEVKRRSQIALEAENVSVLEKMHLSVFWSILKKNSQVNFLQGYTSYEAASIRQLITRMILSTDVANHFRNLEVLRTGLKGGVVGERGDRDETTMIIVENLFHACDIGNPCLDFGSYMNWGALVSYEFDSIARREKELGLQVTGFLKYEGMKKFYGGQLGFCNGLVLPLWRQLAVALPGLTEMQENIQLNIAELQRRKEEESDV